MANLKLYLLLGLTALFFASKSHAVDSIPATQSAGDPSLSSGQCKIYYWNSYKFVQGGVQTLATCQTLLADRMAQSDFAVYRPYVNTNMVYTGSLSTGFKAPGSYRFEFRYLSTPPSVYECLDSNYPILNGSACEPDIFVIDDNLLDQYIAIGEDLKNTAVACGTDGSIACDVKNNYELLMDSLVNELTKQSISLNSSNSDLAGIRSNTDALTNALNSDITNTELSTSLDANQALESQVQNTIDSSNSLNIQSLSSVEQVASQKDSIENSLSEANTTVEDYQSYVDRLEASTTESEWNGVVAEMENNLACAGTYCDVVEEAKTKVNNAQTQLSNLQDLKEPVKEKTEIIASNSTISSNSYDNSKTIIDNSTTVINGGTGSSGDTDGEPSESFSSAIYEYEPKYQDGINGVITNRVAEFKSGELYSSLGNLVITLSGARPAIVFNTGLFGIFDLNIPPYVWDIIKAIMILTCGFLCRRIIFGG